MGMAALARCMCLVVALTGPLVVCSLELFQFPPPPPMKPGWASLPEQVGLQVN